MPIDKNYFKIPLTAPRWELAVIVLLGMISAYLMLINLDYAEFWHDEAVNAIMARALANTGTLSGWDGRNLFFGSTDVVYKQLYAVTNDLTIAYPPWPAVPSALGILIFGDGEFGVRFPHAVLGVLCLPVFYALLRRNFPDSPRLRMMAFALFALSPIFLLYARQGRYYPDAVLFSLLAFFFYQKYMRGDGLRSLAAACVFVVLNFLNHYGVGFIYALSLALWHVVCFRRDTSKRQWLEMTVAGAVCGAACLGWLLWSGVIGSGAHLEYGEGFYKTTWLTRHLFLLMAYFRDIIHHGWLPLWVALWWMWFSSRRSFLPSLLAGFQPKAKGKRKGRLTFGQQLVKRFPAVFAPPTVAADAGELMARQLALLVVILTFWASIMSVQPIKHTVADMRYLLPALPFVILMAAVFADWVWSKSKAFGAGLLTVLLFSNFAGFPYIAQGALCGVNIFKPYAVKEPFTLFALMGEVHRPYPTANGEVISYLHKHAKQDDTIFVQPWPDHAVLLYYLSDKLIFCCGLPQDALLPKDKITALNIPIYAGSVRPEWYVRVMGKDKEVGGYEKVETGTIYSYPTHRPEVEFHCFYPPNQRASRAAIYRKIKEKGSKQSADQQL